MSSESSDDWDVEAYKTDHEPADHWELRKRFMLTHKDRVPEDELVCLAQVFTNIEFLGCRYPNKTMIKIAELAKGVAEEFRESRKDRLKRTFITASDAASSKISGQKKKGEEEVKAESSPKKVKGDTVDLTEEKSETSDSPSNLVTKTIVNPHYSPSSSNTKKYGGVKTFDVASSRNYSNEGLNKPVKKTNGPFSEFVLFLKASEWEHPVSTIERNASVNKQTIRWHLENISETEKKCSLFLNEKLLASETGTNMKSVKESAAKAGIEKLQECCYTIKIKAMFVSDKKVDSSTLGVESQNPNSGKQLGSDNIGMKLMKLMGWEGGGLGSKQQGIEEPISVSIQVRREGLGQTEKNSDINSFKKKARTYIKDWLNSNSDQDLVFSSEFDNAERKAMHEVASQFSLKSRSYGKDESRHLVISKKPSPWQIVEELAATGGTSDKYELIYPSKT